MTDMDRGICFLETESGIKVLQILKSARDAEFKRITDDK